MTGPMLPSGVESKVEQYLKRIWLAPWARSQSQAASDCATASAAGIDRDLSATTPASTPGSAGSPGSPQYCTTRMPPRASVLARSDDPVKSSPMHPSSMEAGSLSQAGHERAREQERRRWGFGIVRSDGSTPVSSLPCWACAR
jgi:hypothetical protein